MAPKRAAKMTEAEFAAAFELDNKAGTIPDPGQQLNRDYAPKGSNIPGLEDLVWDSYTKGEWVVIGIQPHLVDWLKQQLLDAKNWLKYQHRDDEPKVDIRGLEKHTVQVVNVDDIQDARVRAEYRKHVKDGEVGVRFQARPPMMKGQAVVQARKRGTATRPALAATRSGAKPASSTRTRAASTKASLDGEKKQAAELRPPFSG